MNKIKVLDLFAGTQSVRKALELTGKEFDYIGIDIYSPEEKNTILDLTQDDIVNKLIEVLPIGWKPDFIWASPECTAWSLASISHHWEVIYDNKKIIERKPKSDFALLSLKMVKNTKEIIDYFNVPFAIENPRATLRKQEFFKNYFLQTATYCQYGFSYMKPTDIWTNEKINLKMCKNGATCHESAPRGSKTGIQGLKNAKDRSRVPELLIVDIFNQLFNKEQNE